MRSLTLGTRILLLLVGALLTGALVAAAGFSTISSLRGIVDAYGDTKVPALQSLTTLAAALAQAGSDAATVESQGADEAGHAAAQSALLAHALEVRAAIKAFDAFPRSADEDRAWQDTRKAIDAWLTGVGTLDKAAQDRTAKGDNFAAAAAAQQGVSAAFGELTGRARAALERLNDSARFTRSGAEELRQTAKDHAASARTQLAVILAVALALLGAGGALVARSAGRTLSGLKRQAAHLRDAIEAGTLDVRADLSVVGREFQPILAGMNETMEAFARPFRATAECVERIGRGDIPPPISERYHGDFNRAKDSLNGCIAAVNALVADVGVLAQAGVEGRLSVRADAARHQGDFRKVVEGVNATLDAVLAPMQLTADALDALSRGAVPPPVTAELRGDFVRVKDALNRCIGAINALVADANRLAEAGAAGALTTRADAARHQGDFRRVVDGVNRTLDAVVDPLHAAAACVAELAAGKVPARITAPWQGEFLVLRDHLNASLDAVSRLVADAEGQVRAATEGVLDHRADASRHQGDFRRIVEGVNQTLDALVAPMTDATSVLERLARRDLGARMTGRYPGQLARMGEAINATGAALNEALVQVAHAVEQVSSAAAQIASSSQAVASGASEQASALQETATSMESVASMTQHTTESAQQANLLTAAARAAATSGATAVEGLQGAMEKIRKASDRTGEIIKDVSDIAFQTNLLALNAAVEAARAGDAGRGFAVVAEEVRALALRAKEAAAKTEELIREAVKESAAGEAASAEVYGKLGEIVEGVSKASAIVAEIAASAREQTSGMAGVSTAVAEMDKVTQQNAASAEESSSAASELSAQAEELAAMVGSFRLDDDSAAPTAPALARRSAPRRPATPRLASPR